MGPCGHTSAPTQLNLLLKHSLVWLPNPTCTLCVLTHAPAYRPRAQMWTTVPRHCPQLGSDSPHHPPPPGVLHSRSRLSLPGAQWVCQAAPLPGTGPTAPSAVGFWNCPSENAPSGPLALWLDLPFPEVLSLTGAPLPRGCGGQGIPRLGDKVISRRFLSPSPAKHTPPHSVTSVLNFQELQGSRPWLSGCGAECLCPHPSAHIQPG